LQYRERFTDVKGAQVVSRGLLQISIESSQGYQCGINDAQQLHSAEQNIRCAARILNKWVARDQSIGTGRVEPATGEYYETRKNVTSSSSACKTRPIVSLPNSIDWPTNSEADYK